MNSTDTSSVFPSHSLRLKIGAGFAALALLVFGLVGWLSGQQARKQVTGDIGSSLGQLAGRLMSQLDSDMFERYREIQNLAQLNGVIGEPGEPTRWRVVLEQLRTTYSHYAWIGVTDNQGMVVAASGGLLEGKSVKDRPWFEQSQGRPFVGDVHDAVMLGRLLPPGPYGEPLRLVDVAAPILKDGQLVGVLGAHLSWAWAEERRRVVLQPPERELGIAATVVNRAGKLLLPPHNDTEVQLPAEALQRLAQRGPGIETWSDGQPYFSAAVLSNGYREYPGLGWAVVVRQPLQTAMGPAHRIERQIWTLGFLGAALFGLLGWSLAGRLTAPLHALAEQAESLKSGDVPAQAFQVPQRDEVGQLASTLSALILRLQQRSAELTQLNQHLEDRVQERTAAMEMANDDLRSFSHSVSHDLKGPIGSIAQALRRVLDTDRERLNTSSRETLTIVAAECDRLLQLVDELMLLARVENQPLHWAPVSMEALARAAIDRLLASSDNARPEAPTVDVVVSDLPSAEGDAVLLQQVWENLVSNAFKFCRHAATPRIEIAAETKGDEWVYCITDNGSGFDMSQVGRLFGVFQRLHRQSDYPGTGVGLSIVRRIVHRHGGRVWAHSVPGVRTRFYFALPRQTIAVPEAEARRAQPAPGATAPDAIAVAMSRSA